MISDLAWKADILIVDDTPANLRVLGGMLKTYGYKVRPAPNGRLALQGARSDPPDLILLDITMPEMSGYEVCRRLKDHEKTKDVPVIFISALTDTSDKVKAFAAGGVDFITKPFQVEEVHARVEAHLSLKRKTLEIQRLHREQDAFLRHELGNQVGAVMAFAELVLEGQDELTDQQKEWVEQINSAAHQTWELVQRIKQLQDFEREVYELETAPCDVESLVRDVAAGIEATFDFADLKIESGAERTAIEADENLLRGVFHNLLKNAIEHVATLEDERERTIHVGLSNENGQVVTEITNRGDPVPPERLQHFFEKFNTDRTRKGGTGLGTTYAYLVTRAHGGELTVSSSQMDGTTLTVRLPLDQKP